ncbi:MAG TPA: hypothetical protein VFV08_16295, partial [Puia sp.]|nr:hypothetical protein [Puia sp.]
PGTPGPFALSEDGKIESIFEKNQLTLVYKTRVPCPFLYRNLEEGVKAFMGTGPAALAMDHHDLMIVEKTIARAFEPFRVVDDIHFLQNHFLVFIAEKP